MKIVILGCGRWGAGLAQQLHRENHTVTVVDREPAAFERLGASFSGTRLTGSCLDRDIWLRAGVERADGLAALTGNDEINIIMARIARQTFQVPKAVARLHDPIKADIYRRLGLQTVSPVTWGINRMKEMLLFSPLDVSFSIGDGHVDLIQVDTPALLVGRRVEEINLPGEAHIVAISRNGQTFLPAAGARFQTGDRLHLAALTSSMARLKRALNLI